MKRYIGMLALVAATLSPALAANGGISGKIVDADTGKPIVGAPVAIFRMPVHESELATATVTTDREGFFSNIALQPGRYLVTAVVMGRPSGCTIDDVFDGNVTRMKIAVGGDGTTHCSGPRVHSATVNPSMTADIYIMH